MKLRAIAQFVFFVTVLSAGILSLARWFHPATFAIGSLWLLFIAAFASATIIIFSHD